MSTDRPKNLSASEALSRLKEGNARYVAGKLNHPNCTVEHRSSLSSGQSPFAIVLTCADSRVPPELIFDQGLGDLFVIRVAGNIADDAVIGSIEYAVLHLGVNLVTVMGHQSCGAVGAAVANVDLDGPATHSHIDSLIDSIRPAVKRVVSRGDSDVLESSIRENATSVASDLRASKPVLADVRELTLSPSYYSLASGEVSWL